MPMRHSWQPPSSPWHSSRRHKRRFLFVRFAAMFGFLLFIFLVGTAVIYSFVYKPIGDVFPRPWILLLAVCGVPLSFAVLAAVVGGLVFRRMGTPLVDVMAAADAVAEGDLTVRVREDIPGEFGRLARSFNRMTAELARAEQQRRNMTADVAHELRTPLHIIQGNLEGVLDGIYAPTREHIGATLEETRLLARLVSDLQTLSLAEAGQLPLHPQTLLAADLLEDVRTSFSGQAAAGEVEVLVDVPAASSELVVSADHDRLDQVISNLVANALQHTPPGGRIFLGADADEEWVRLTVKDNGAGIAEADLPFVFDRFWRGDPSRARKAGSGSGLGLAIARQIVQAHGGKITVESQVGQGAAFTVWLPPNGAPPTDAVE